MVEAAVPVVVAAGASVPRDPQELLNRSQVVSLQPPVNSLAALKDRLSYLAPEGSCFSILWLFPYGNIWVPFDGNIWVPFDGDLHAERLVFVKIERPTVVHLAYSPTPVRTSKRQKYALFQGKTRRVLLHALIGDSPQYEHLAALNWLWLHLYGSSQSLQVFLKYPSHERRYYPYARALFKAAAGGTGIQVSGQDGSASEQPDIQLKLRDGEVVPVDVKTEWGYGSVNDPDGIYKNADTLERLLRYVRAFNQSKVNDFTTLTCVTAGLEYVFFFKFYIEKAGAGNEGELTMLEHSPGFSTGCLGATGGLEAVRIINMDKLVEGKFAHDTFGDILPPAAPAGFLTLVTFLNKLAGQVASQVTLKYVSTKQDTDTVTLSHLLAYGPKSCVFSTHRGDTVIKVSCPAYIEIDRKAYAWIDNGGCPYLRKMVGYGSVLGTLPGLVFLELEGLGVPFSPKHVSSPERLQKCWEQSSVAVEFMHSKQVFHRDIKPDNFIVLDTGKTSERLVLNDLDCAACWGQDDLSQDVGTRMFRSPLRVQHDNYRCCDDWLSLGLTFASLMGLHPSEADDSKKNNILNGLLAHEWVPENMKNRIRSALAGGACCSDTKTEPEFNQKKAKKRKTVP